MSFIGKGGKSEVFLYIKLHLVRHALCQKVILLSYVEYWCELSLSIDDRKESTSVKMRDVGVSLHVLSG